MATIKVTVHEARDLPVMDRNSGLTDSYVVLRFSTMEQSTGICWRTRHPIWESTYRFDVPDLLALQEEPLEVRVFDHDVISRDDIVGSIIVDCNSIIDRGEETGLSGWFPLYDVSDGMRGEVRLTIKVKFHTTHNPFAPQLPDRYVRCLKLYADGLYPPSSFTASPSSNPLLYLEDNYDPVAPLRVQHPTLSSEEEGVYMFAASRLDPSLYRVETTRTMVEELIVTADPDNARLTNFKSSRSRNEARVLQLFKLSGKVRRQLARKVVEMKCNAIVGLVENFDIEPGCLVVRAYGTPVVLSKVKHIHEGKAHRWWKKNAAHIIRGSQSDMVQGGSGKVPLTINVTPSFSNQVNPITHRTSASNSVEENNSHGRKGGKKPISRAATATPDSSRPLTNNSSLACSEHVLLPPPIGTVNPLPTAVSSYVPSNPPPPPQQNTNLNSSSTDPSKITANPAGGFGSLPSSSDLLSLEVLAGNFSLTFDPSLIGVPPQRHPLDPTLVSATSAEDLPTSTPLLSPTLAATAAAHPGPTSPLTNPPVSTQRTSVLILTLRDLPSGSIQHLGGYISVRSVKIVSKVKSKIMISQERDAWWMEMREELRVNCRAMHCNTILDYKEEAQFFEDVVILLLSGTAAMVDHGLLPLRVGPDYLFRQAKESIEKRQNCGILHLYHGRNTGRHSGSPALMETQHSICQVCHHRPVAEVMIASCALPAELMTETPPQLLHATVSKPKKLNSKGVDLAQSISQALPYIEFALHRQLLFQLRLAKLNACFGIRVDIVVGPEVIVGSLTGTGFRLAALPLLSAPQLQITDRSLGSSETVQRLKEVMERQKKLLRKEQASYSSSTSSDSSYTGSDGEEENTKEYLDEYSIYHTKHKNGKGRKKQRAGGSAASTPPSDSTLQTPTNRQKDSRFNESNAIAEPESEDSWLPSSPNSSSSSSSSSNSVDSDEEYYYRMGGGGIENRGKEKRNKGDFIISIDDLDEADMYIGTLDGSTNYENSVLLTTPYVPDYVNNFDLHERIILTRRYAILSSQQQRHSSGNDELVYGGGDAFNNSSSTNNFYGVDSNERGLSTRMFNQCCADAKRAFVQHVCRIAMHSGGGKDPLRVLRNINEVKSFVVERLCVTDFKISIWFGKNEHLSSGGANSGVTASNSLGAADPRHGYHRHDINSVVGGRPNEDYGFERDASIGNGLGALLYGIRQTFDSGVGKTSIGGGGSGVNLTDRGLQMHSLLYLRLEGMLMMATNKGKKRLMGLEERAFQECLRYAKEDLSQFYYPRSAGASVSGGGGNTGEGKSSQSATTITNSLPNELVSTGTGTNDNNNTSNPTIGSSTALTSPDHTVLKKTMFYHSQFRLFRNVTSPFSLSYVMEYNPFKLTQSAADNDSIYGGGGANKGNNSFNSVNHSADASINGSMVVGGGNMGNLFNLSGRVTAGGKIILPVSLPTKNYYSFYYQNNSSGTSVNHKKKNRSKTSFGEKLESVGQSVVEWVGRKTNMLNINSKAGTIVGEEGNPSYADIQTDQSSPPHHSQPDPSQPSSYRYPDPNQKGPSPYLPRDFAPQSEQTVVHYTPLDYVSGKVIVRYLGYLSQHFVREVTNLSTAAEESKCVTRVEMEMQTQMSSWVLLLGGNTLLNHEIIYHELSFSDANDGTCFIFATVRGDAALTSSQVRSTIPVRRSKDPNDGTEVSEYASSSTFEDEDEEGEEDEDGEEEKRNSEDNETPLA